MYTFILKNLRSSLYAWIILTCLTSCQSIHLPVFSKDISDTSEEIYESDNDDAKKGLYQVLGTDTISSIARKHRVSPQELIDINNLRKPYTLKPGQLLKIPAYTSSQDNINENAVSVDTSQEVRIGPKER